MQSMYSIDLDVHKRTILDCVKDLAGQVFAEGKMAATRPDRQEGRTF